jgi:hypothetical protein
VVELVFHTWMKHRLTAEEHANVLDFPVDRAVEMTGEELLALTRKEIPGKVLTAASWFLEHWDTAIRNDEQMNEPLPKSEERVQPDVKSNHNKTDQSYLDLRLEAKMLRFLEERVNDVVKDDDTAAPVHPWNNQIAIGLSRMRREQSGNCGRQRNPQPYFDFDEDNGIQKYSKFLGTFRKLLQPAMLKRWKANVRSSFETWYEVTGKHMPQAADILADGLKACEKADGASWWEWDAGSALLFWRWPKDYIKTAWSGITPMFDSDPPGNQDRQPPYEEDEVRIKVKAKLEKVLAKGYIEIVDIELVEAMMFMFHVQKVPDDIQLVYDRTKSGLNKSVYASWFALPTIDSMSRWIIAGA